MLYSHISKEDRRRIKTEEQRAHEEHGADQRAFAATQVHYLGNKL